MLSAIMPSAWLSALRPDTAEYSAPKMLMGEASFRGKSVRGGGGGLGRDEACHRHRDATDVECRHVVDDADAVDLPGGGNRGRDRISRCVDRRHRQRVVAV